MKKYFLQLVLPILLAFSFSGKVNSQSIDETLSVLSSDAAVKYSQPAVTAFGTNMNSGWFSGLPTATNGLHVKLRFVGIGSLFTTDARRFSSTGEFRFSSSQVDDILKASDITRAQYGSTYDQLKDYILNESWNVKIDGPTIIGSNDESLHVKFPGKDIPVELPDGSTQYYTVDTYSISVNEVTGFLNNLPLLPTPAIQLDISSIFGTGFSFRYFKGVNIEDLGEIDIFGVGLTHNVKYWLPESFPVNVGVAFYYQKFNLGTVFNNNSFKTGIYFGKDFGSFISISPYVGISYESSTTRIRYNYKFDTPTGVENVDVSVDYDPMNTVALTLGSTVNFPVVSLNFDFKFADTNAATVGLGFGF